VTLLLDYNYHGAASDAEFKQRMQEVESLPISLRLNITSYKHWWNFVQGKDIHEDLIVPVSPFANGLMSSVAVSQETATTSLPAFLTQSLQDFASGAGASTHMFYHLAGANATMAAASSEVSLHTDFHQAMFHYITSAPAPENLYTLGKSSYFSESAYSYDGDSWKTRYWGQNYAKLENVKHRYDKANLFWCHNCVGSDLPRPHVSTDAVLV
jgi:FAD/FMN-containing dehydrogenase